MFICAVDIADMNNMKLWEIDAVTQGRDGISPSTLHLLAATRPDACQNVELPYRVVKQVRHLICVMLGVGVLLICW